MTTQRASLPVESLQTGGSYNGTASSATPVVIQGEFGVTSALSLPNTISLEELAKEQLGDARKRAHLANARKQLAKDHYCNEPATLSSLRLEAGMSQTELAKVAGTVQAHIARIEAGKNDPSTDLIARIATALNRQEEIVYKAVRYQIVSRGQLK